MQFSHDPMVETQPMMLDSGSNGRVRASAAMIGLAVSVGASSVFLPQMLNRAVAAESPTMLMAALAPSGFASDLGAEGAVPNEASVHQPILPGRDQSAEVEHTVQPGQTLWQISRMYEVDVQAIASANRMNPDSLLLVGQVLEIPKGLRSQEKAGTVMDSLLNTYGVASAPTSTPQSWPVSLTRSQSMAANAEVQVDEVAGLEVIREKPSASTTDFVEDETTSGNGVALIGGDSSSSQETESAMTLGDLDPELSQFQAAALEETVADETLQMIPTVADSRESGDVSLSDDVQSETEPYIHNLLAEVRELQQHRGQVGVSTQEVAVQGTSVQSAPVVLVSLESSSTSPLVTTPETPARLPSTDLPSSLVTERQPKQPTPTPQAVALHPQEQKTPQGRIEEQSIARLRSLVEESSQPDLPPLASAETYLPENRGAFSGYVWPTKGVLTSGYGWRWGRMHKGIDLAAPVGTPIYAAAPGVVEYARWNAGGYGNLVDIRHPDGSLTRYAHNNRLLVKEGEWVEQGQQISELGNTGRSTGPHLHFEIHPAGKGAINPIALLPKQ